MSEHATPREAMEFDVVIVGAGPAGLSAAIRLKQLAPETGVCVVEKGGEVGAHILSGAVIEPRALDELLPDWRDRGAPLTTKATEDRFLFLTATRAFKLPTPPQMHNEGNYIVSLGETCRWLGQQAEALGVEIYPGFAAAEVLIEDGRVVGVATGDMGIEKSGEHGANYQPGMELRAPYTLFAEGCRGSLSKQVTERFHLREGRNPQTYAIGIKELWEIPAANHRPGLVEHAVGWPLDSRTYGGSWLYHFGDNLVSYGFVVGPGLQQPLAVPLRRDAALQDPPGHPQAFRGRAPHQLRRACAQRGRPAVHPQADLPRRRPDRRHRRLPERAEDQGHPRRHEVRHAGRGGRRRGPCQWPSRRARGLRGSLPRSPGCTRSCTAPATCARPSPSWGFTAASPTRRSTPTSSAARRPGPSSMPTPTTRACARPPPRPGSPIPSRTAR